MSITGAIKEWQKAIGEENVRISSDILKAVETATFVTKQRIPAVIRPGSTEEVQKCMRIANRNGIAVYPVSKGKNWGLGSRVPPESAVLMELERMNRISDFNEEMAYVTIEPGVTFQQLFDLLNERKSGLMMDGIGSTPESSIIGNTMERGHGLGPYGERFDHVCGLQVVLPTGEIMNTGMERFDGSAVAKLHRWGIGPFTDGMFTQSNLGIVTRMNLFLMVKPAFFQSYFFDVNDENKLVDLFDTMHRLRHSGVNTVFRIFNDHRLISFITQYPWKETNGVTPLPDHMLKKLRKIWVGFGQWNVHGAIFSPSRAAGMADRKMIMKAFRGKVDRMFFLDEMRAKLIRLIAPLYNWIMGVDLIKFVDWGFSKSILRGTPSIAALNMCYWRKKTPIPAVMDPDKDRCGVHWYCPTVPFQGKHVLRAIRIIYDICAKYKLEPNMGLLCMSERVIDMTGALIYDRDVPGEDARAMACHNELVTTLMKAGYYPYRLGLQQYDLMPSPIDDTVVVMNRIKKALDPKNILAPGRYEPEPRNRTKTKPARKPVAKKKAGKKK